MGVSSMDLNAHVSSNGPAGQFPSFMASFRTGATSPILLCGARSVNTERASM